MEKKGSALYLCPGCGAFVSESARKCPSCGELLEDDFDEQTLDDIESTVADLEAVEELAYLDEELNAGADSEPVALFLCTTCGAFTGGDATICPKCGTSLVSEEPPIPEIAPQPSDPELLGMLVEAETPEVEDMQILEDLKKLESAEDVESFLEAINDEVESEIEISLTPPEELLPERSEDSDDLLSKLIMESAEGARPDKEAERSKAMDTVENLLVHDGSGGASSGDNDTIALCTQCGAFVSETAQVCNICGNALAGRKLVASETGAEDIGPESDGEQADSVMRNFLGVASDAVLDQGAGSRFQSDGSLGLCTICGAFVGQDADSCPVCGTHVGDMPEFVPSMDIIEPEQEEHGLAICPHCGVFVQEGAKECLSCVKPIPEGAAVPVTEGVQQAEDPESAFRTLKTFLGVEKALETAPVRDGSFKGLDLCPDCGAFVSMDAVVCSICGNSLFEDADDDADFESEMALPETMKCPNCDARMGVHAESCPSCGMSFVTERASLEEPGDDITEFLDRELEDTIRKLESKTLPEPELEPLPELEAEPEPLMPEDDLSPSIEEELPVGIVEYDAPEHLEPEPLPGEPDPLEFLEEEIPEPEYDMDDEPLMEDMVASPESAAELPEVDSGTRTSINSANWTAGVYVSVTAICFFLFFYAIAPGDYAPGLAFIFGTLLLFGSYLAATEKTILFKGDLRHATVFILGVSLSAFVLVHRPLGLLAEGSVTAGQILLSLSILLTSIGLLWIRARVRFVFTWFSGNTLLFLASMVSFLYPGLGSGTDSPVILVAGFGAGQIFLSLVFLQYERAINSSIETDIVRGDAHYLKRDYVKAMASYDNALAKAQMKKVEVLGSPIVQYDVPWYSKGSALILMGEFEEGIRCLDMALAINPNNEVTWVNKGNAHSRLGQLDTAMECYRRAIECNPFYEIAWNNLGNVFARQKDYLESLKHYNRAIKINPGYDDAWINKGYVLAKMGKRDQAVKCLNHVGSRAKGSPAKVDRDIHLL